MKPGQPSIADKRRTFHQLHASGCFVIPNPWDLGSALYLQRLGFKALATTSSGFAWSRARPDNGVVRDAVLDHLREMVDATDLPLNADFESGFAHDAAGVAESVRLAIATGVAGLSIEDSTGDADNPLYAIDIAIERMRAARAAINSIPSPARHSGAPGSISSMASAMASAPISPCMRGRSGYPKPHPSRSRLA